MKFNNQIIKFDKNIIKKVNIRDTFFTNIFSLNGIIAGGFARYVVDNNAPAPHDIDVFCRKPDDFADLDRYFRNYGIVKHDSEFATMFDLSKSFPYIEFVVQLIKPREEGNIKTFGTPTEIISNFDFTINMIAFTDCEFVMASRFLNHAKRKKLVFNNIHCAAGILVRLRKYFRKGFTMSIAEMSKIYDMWDSMNKNDKTEMMNALGNFRKEEAEDDRLLEEGGDYDEVQAAVSNRIKLRIASVRYFDSEDDEQPKRVSNTFRIFYVD